MKTLFFICLSFFSASLFAGSLCGSTSVIENCNEKSQESLNTCQEVCTEVSAEESSNTTAEFHISIEAENTLKNLFFSDAMIQP